MPKLDGWNLDSPRWSPDGSWIAFDARPNSNGDIYVIPSEGGEPRRVTTHSAEDAVPSWSRDGRWIYFMSTRSGEEQIWKVLFGSGETASSPAVQVTRGGGIQAMESADSKYLYFAKGRDKPGLWREDIATPDGQEEPVLESLQARGWWTLGPRGVYFLEQPPKPLHAKLQLKFSTSHPGKSTN